MAVETVIRSGRPEFDGLFPLVRGFLEQSALDLAIDGARVRGDAETRRERAIIN